MAKKTKISDKLKEQQTTNIQNTLNKISANHKKVYSTISGILDDNSIPFTYKTDCILWNLFEENLPLDELEQYLKDMKLKKDTKYRKLLCAYDIKKYE